MSDRIERVSGEHAVAGLTDVLHALGAELRRASETTDERTITFGSAEVELDVSIETTAGGGFNFWVVDVNGGATYARTARITVSLYPGEQQMQMGGK